MYYQTFEFSGMLACMRRLDLWYWIWHTLSDAAFWVYDRKIAPSIAPPPREFPLRTRFH